MEENERMLTMISTGENTGMSDKELMYNLIDTFERLQRLKAAENKEKEIEYQLSLVRAKLEAMGIVTENLELK